MSRTEYQTKSTIPAPADEDIYSFEQALADEIATVGAKYEGRTRLQYLVEFTRARWGHD